MTCAGCGQPLTEGVSVCLRCGTPLPRDLKPKAVEAALTPDPVLPSGDNWPSLAAPTSPYGEYSATEPPPPPLYTTSGALGTPPYATTEPVKHAPTRPMFLSIALVILLAAGGFGAFNYAHAAGWLGRFGNHSGGGVGAAPGTASAINCAVPAIDPVAKYNLTEVQLTTGLRDEAHKDYEPVNDVSYFHLGTSVYVTFRIASNAAADLNAQWCWGAGNSAHYQLNLTHNRDVRGYFKLSNVDTNALGQGSIVIRWNGAVAVAIPFTVER